LMDFGGSRFVVLLAVFVENQVFWNVTLCYLASISLIFRRIAVNARSTARSMTWTSFFWLPDPEYEGTMTSRHVKLPAQWPRIPLLETQRFKLRVS
jgi:hypothetical protein